MRRKITVAFGVDKWSRDEMNSGLRTERQGSEGMKHVEHRRPATHPALWQYTPGLMAERIQAVQAALTLPNGGCSSAKAAISDRHAFVDLVMH